MAGLNWDVSAWQSWLSCHKVTSEKWPKHDGTLGAWEKLWWSEISLEVDWNEHHWHLQSV
jgi:hypothetical protein